VTLELLPLSIGIGLAVGLLFTELFGITAGGMIVPGYLALYLTRPASAALTVGGGLLTFLIVRALSSFVILYGRRRTVSMILVGYLLGLLVNESVSGLGAKSGLDYQIIGYIIPGLIAIWLDRQGVIETLSTLLTTSVVVRLLLVVVCGADLPR
jgi:poly-gamma-glutamate biosynthesis protein PgsC/CapC